MGKAGFTQGRSCLYSFSYRILSFYNTVTLIYVVDDAKRLWKNLRERYSKERKQVAKLPVGAKPLWPYFEPMKFMQKHIVTRK